MKKLMMTAGFTLAEVLITLLIIGVVASLVIPAIIQDTQNAELKTAYKRDFSILNQAIIRLAQDNGGTIKGIWDNDLSMREALSNYFNYTKKCSGDPQVWGNCWHRPSNFHYLNNTLTGFGNGYALVLADGSFLSIDKWPASNETCNGENGTVTGICGSFYVDVNGFKGPNIVGKDIYGVFAFSNSIKPYGMQGDEYVNTCVPNSIGLGCSAKYLYE